MLVEPIAERLARWRADLAAGRGDRVAAEAEAVLATIAHDAESVVTALAAGRPDAATVLARLAGLADDDAGLDAVVERLVSADSIGVLSDGPRTISVLEALARRTDEIVPLVTDRPSVARGLLAVGAHAVVDDPAAADRLLLPAVAVHETRVWSSSRILDAADRATAADATAVLVHVRPLAHLDAEARLRFRPPPWVTDRADERWTVPWRPTVG